MKESIKNTITLANGQNVNVETFTRHGTIGNKSTFISINTGCFRIHIVQRSKFENLKDHPNAQIGFSTTSETDNLLKIETLALSLNEAIKFAKKLNENVMN